MIIKEVKVGTVNDSRGKKTIIISINNCWTAAPSGASKGKHEIPSYRDTIKQDFQNLNKHLGKLSDFEFKKFDDLKYIEKLLRNKIGANTLFALEASVLKALAKEQGKELFQLLGGEKIPKILSNLVGGGAHSHTKKKPDFQEFLVIGDKKFNIKAYNEAKKLVKAKTKNDENAWNTNFGNKEVLEIMKWDGKTGIDAAASQLYLKGRYFYKNPRAIKTRREQIEYIVDIINENKLKYVEDPLQEEDFNGFAEILARTTNCLIVGDDLTTTNLARTQKAIDLEAINGLIVKPNQIGSLLEVKQVIDLCKKNKIKIIISHRSGETMDDTIADLAVGFGADMIKIPVAGKERLAKVERLEKIKKKKKKKKIKN